jgi:hypothetical protein
MKRYPVLLFLIILCSCAPRKKAFTPPPQVDTDISQIPRVEEPPFVPPVTTVVATETITNYSDWMLFSKDHWSYYSERRRQIDTTQTIWTNNVHFSFSGESKGNGTRVSTTRKYRIRNSKIFVRWKAEGGNKFSDFHISVYYDQNSPGADYERRTDLTNHSIATTAGCSTLIREYEWYCTLITIKEGRAEVITRMDDGGDCQTGQIVDQKNIWLSADEGYLALRIGEPYEGKNTSMSISHFRLDISN